MAEHDDDSSLPTDVGHGHHGRYRHCCLLHLSLHMILKLFPSTVTIMRSAAAAIPCKEGVAATSRGRNTAWVITNQPIVHLKSTDRFLRSQQRILGFYLAWTTARYGVKQRFRFSLSLFIFPLMYCL
ncbi:unnamed protein product [Victoria cruziana]